MFVAHLERASWLYLMMLTKRHLVKTGSLPGRNSSQKICLTQALRMDPGLSFGHVKTDGNRKCF